MIINIKQLFTGKADVLDIDCTLDFSGFEYQNNRPFKEPVRVSGKISASAGIVVLNAVAEFVFHCACDRCLAEIDKPMQVPISHDLVTSSTEDDNDKLVLVENYELPLDDLVLEDLILNLPSKNLCREDCPGICPICGKDLKSGYCGCRSDKIDPRFAILKQLTEQTD
ncbi:MAG TPA: DUF177 domain-containing protein [Clostridiales bacterium]|nr:DUF177 domain-containing protein [Clostridiales bacterium]